MLERTLLTKMLAVIGLVCLLSLTSITSAQQEPRMEHNAFLRKPVLSAEGLTEQVGSDPVVLKRYEKHFMMDKKGLKDYMAKLRLKPLGETKRFYVYNVDKKFVIRKRLLTVRRGTMVFVDPNGKPVLKRSCGNPLISYLPPKG
ncbi:MAG: hypothetical protein EOP85_22720, partial [Verrucomicrobiaceae bacterium]